jgi:hypothetical protein
MVQDLTSKFMEAEKHALIWKKGEFDQAISQLKQSPVVTIDWDSSVPERWVGVATSNVNSAAVIHTEFPLVIVLGEVEAVLRATLTVSGIVYVAILDFETESYSLDADRREEFFPHNWSDAIDINSFTIRELIYATI